MGVPEPSLNDVLIGIARIEEKLVALTDKLEKLEDQTDEKFKRINEQVDTHTKKLGEHEKLIALLKEKAPMRVNVWTIVLGVTSLVTVVLLVLDRIFKA